MSLFLQSFSRGVCLLIAIIFLLGLLGTMPVWSQSNDSNLNDSQSSLQTWNELYNQGQKILQKQNAISENLNKEILTLKIGFGELTNLSAELSQSNESLKTYNEQIAERMQERDEDLAWAYDKIDAQALTIAQKDTKIAKQTTHIIILYVALGLIVIGIIAIAIVKGYIKMKLPIRF